MIDRASLVVSMHRQLQDWPHMASPGHAADRELLLTMAEGIDAARDSVANGSAALPLINACRYVLEALRKLAPAAADDDGFDTDMAWEE